MNGFSTIVEIGEKATLHVSRPEPGAYLEFRDDSSALLIHLTEEQYEMLRHHFSTPESGKLHVGLIWMPTKLRNALKNAGVTTLEQAAALRIKDFIDQPHVGRTTVKWLYELLRRHGVEHCEPEREREFDGP